MKSEEIAGLNGSPLAESTAEAQPPFEEALHQLEEVVELLESGNVPLEQSIALARRGLALAEYCDTVVSQAEATLEQLVATADGELVTQRLAYDDDDVEEDVTASEHD